MWMSPGWEGRLRVCWSSLTCADLCLEPVLQPSHQCRQDVHAQENHLQGQTSTASAVQWGGAGIAGPCGHLTTEKPELAGQEIMLGTEKPATVWKKNSPKLHRGSTT